MINIRRATERDIPRIVELYEELTEEQIEVPLDTLKQVFAEIAALPNQEFLVAEVDNYIAGSLFYQIIPNLSHNARPWAIVENVIVDNRFRRQGIGYALIRRALNRCKESNCYKVQLLSHKKRVEAHEFYRALGFEESALGFRIYL